MSPEFERRKKLADDELLFRRVPRGQLKHLLTGDGKIARDENGTVAISQSYFKDSANEVSVDRACIEPDPTKTQNNPADGVLKMVAGELHAIDSVPDQRIIVIEDALGPFSVVNSKVTFDPNPAHALIVASPDGLKNRALEKYRIALTLCAEWVLEPS